MALFLSLVPAAHREGPPSGLLTPIRMSRPVAFYFQRIGCESCLHVVL